MLESHHIFSDNGKIEYSMSSAIKASQPLALYDKVQFIGELNVTHNIPSSTTIADSLYSIEPSLKTFFESSDYVVGDCRTSQAVTADIIIEKDMKFNVMKKHSLEFVTEGDESSVNTTAVAEGVSLLVGIPSEEVVVVVSKDEEDGQVHIFVYLPSEELVNIAGEAVDNMDKDNCPPDQPLCPYRRLKVDNSLHIDEGNHGGSMLLMVFISLAIALKSL